MNSRKQGASPIGRIAAHLMDLLQEPDRSTVARELENSRDARQTLAQLRRLAADWAFDEETHLSPAELATLVRHRRGPVNGPGMSHLLACRDCRFEAELVLADDEIAHSIPGRGRIWPVAAIAASLLLGFVGLQVGRWTAPLPANERTIEIVDLTATRGEQGRVGLRLSQIEAASVLLSMEIRSDEPEVRWEIVDRNGQKLLIGTAPFEAGVPPLRQLEILIPRDVLRPGLFTVQVAGVNEPELRTVAAFGVQY